MKYQKGDTIRIIAPHIPDLHCRRAIVLGPYSNVAYSYWIEVLGKKTQSYFDLVCNKYKRKNKFVICITYDSIELIKNRKIFKLEERKLL